MSYSNLPESDRTKLYDLLSKDPLIWAKDSIFWIDAIIAAGTHEPKGDMDDPDFTVEQNRNYLVNTIDLFNELDLAVPEEIQPAIDRANDFLKDAA